MASLSDLQQENNVTSSEEHGYENPWPKEDRNVKPSSPQPTARFLVEQVKNEPKDRMELSDSDSGAHSRVLSDSSRHSITDGTIGYATNEAVPMTIFYRNEYSQSHEKKYRPTLQELQKGFGEVPEQQVIEVWCVREDEIDHFISLAMSISTCVLLHQTSTNTHKLNSSHFSSV